MKTILKKAVASNNESNYSKKRVRLSVTDTTFIPNLRSKSKEEINDSWYSQIELKQFMMNSFEIASSARKDKNAMGNFSMAYKITRSSLEKKRPATIDLLKNWSIQSKDEYLGIEDIVIPSYSDAIVSNQIHHKKTVLEAQKNWNELFGKRDDHFNETLRNLSEKESNFSREFAIVKASSIVDLNQNADYNSSAKEIKIFFSKRPSWSRFKRNLNKKINAAILA